MIIVVGAMTHNITTFTILTLSINNKYKVTLGMYDT
jgi:hypothetical protein